MTAASNTNYQTVVQELYVAYFGRPADYYGLTNFENALASANAPTTLSGLLAAYGTNSAITLLINSFGTSAESAALYGTVSSSSESAAQFVSAIFENLFNRLPATGGLNFWVNALVSGQITPGNAALQIAAGAFSATGSTTDQNAFNNKVTVATDFTANLTTTADIIGYSGATAAATARQLITGVTATTVPTTYESNVLATIAQIAGNPQGTAVNLTTGLDNVSGSNFQAVINATTPAQSTLNTLDTLTGTSANNILTISVVGAAPALPASVTLNNVQTIDVKAASGLNFDFTTSNYSGVSAVNVLTSAGTDTLKVGAGVDAVLTDSSSTGAVTVEGGTNVIVTTANGNVTIGDVTAPTGVVTVTDAGTGTIAVTGGTAATINVSSAAFVAGSIAVNGGTNVSVAAAGTTTGTISVGGVTAAAGTITVTDSFGSATKGASVNGGAIQTTGGTVVSVTDSVSELALTTTGANGTVTQGAVTVTGTSTTTSVSVTQAATVAAKATAVAVAGATAVYSETFGALTAGQTLSVGGVTFTAGAAGTTAAETAAAFANLATGAFQGNSTYGTYSDTTGFTGWTTGAVVSTTSGSTTSYSVNFTSTTPDAVEAAPVFGGTGAAPTSASVTTGAPATTAVAGVVGIADGTVVIADAGGANASAVTTASIDGFSGANNTIATNHLTTLSLADGSGTVTVTDTAAATSALALTVSNVTGGTLVAGFETLNITTAKANSSLVITDATATGLTVAGTEALVLSGSTFTDLKTAVVTGAAGVTVDVSGDASFTDFNASATSGSNHVTINAANATYEGGSGGDSVTLSSSTVAHAITLGAGSDTVTLAANTTAVSSTINGGGGTNTLAFTNAADAATASASNTFAQHVTNFQDLLLNSVTTNTINVSELGGYNYVTHVGSGALTIDNIASGGTLVLANSVTVGAAPTDTVSITGATASAPAASLNLVLTGDSQSSGVVTAANVTKIAIQALDTNTSDAAGAGVDSLTLHATAATSLTVTGNAHLTLVTTADNALTLIDASGMTGGITATTNGVVAETIKGGAADNVLTAGTGTTADTLIAGAGNDILTANAGLDTLTGSATANDTFDIVASANANSYATIMNAHIGDTIEFTGAHAAVSFAASAVTLAPTAVFQDYVNAAVHETGVQGAISWFQYGGNTYIVENQTGAESSFTNGTDLIVKLNGTVDLSHTSLSTTHSSLLIG